ncbi:MAG: ribosomal protein S18-alanine N-acetyltransferase [Desulfobacterales bacterium]|nr:ribosomal protein S18-alanine N-acetyltransferase [Desulfobacterales bacterium]
MTSIVGVNPENQPVYLDRILAIETLSFPSPWSFGAFEQEVKNPISRLWVLTANKAVAGYICFWIFDAEIQLINVAVHPKARGRGYAEHLLNRMIESGLSKGIHQVWLEVRLSNVAAQGLYRKLGFEEVGRRPRYYGDTDEDAIVMSLTISEGVIRCNVCN